MSFSIQEFLTTISKTKQKFLADSNDDCTSLLLVLLEKFSTQLLSLMLKQGKREDAVRKVEAQKCIKQCKMALVHSHCEVGLIRVATSAPCLQFMQHASFHSGLGFLMYMAGKTFPGWLLRGGREKDKS